VFGGSFDPPHFYHTIAPLSVAVRCYEKDAWVLYVPAARSPFKPQGPMASDKHRLAMLNLALDVPGPRSIWTDELDRAAWNRDRGVDGPSFMIDTLRRLRRVVPRRVELRLLIGSDQVRDFQKWKSPREIIRIAEPLVLAREPVTTASSLMASLDKDFWTRAECRAWCKRLAPNFPIEQSSTELRDAIPGAPRDVRRWDKVPGLSGIIAPVARYIVKHSLYGFRAGKPRPAPTIKPLTKGMLRLDQASMTVLGAMLVSAGHSVVKQAKRPRKTGRRRSVPSRPR
jgi:nicotinate-nucleotide adenylyltransferase